MRNQWGRQLPPSDEWAFNPPRAPGVEGWGEKEGGKRFDLA